MTVPVAAVGETVAVSVTLAPTFVEAVAVSTVVVAVLALAVTETALDVLVV
jgi:hypothetical protein